MRLALNLKQAGGSLLWWVGNNVYPPEKGAELCSKSSEKRRFWFLLKSHQHGTLPAVWMGELLG